MFNFPVQIPQVMFFHSCGNALSDWRRGLKVIATTADGASVNRKFFKMHRQASGKDGEVVYKTVNVYSPEKRPLFFISDVPHLIKTVRNCWSNSFAHTKTRTLKVGI